VSETWITQFPSVAEDNAIVSQLIDTARKAPDPEDFDIHAMRARNPERLGGPLIRKAVPGTTKTPAIMNGIGGEWIDVPGGSERITILYFHGGAFIRGSLMQGRGIASSLAAEVKGRAFAVDYRQAPEHPFPAPVDDGVSAYRGLLERGVDRGSIVFAGDSCGGAIPVSVMLKLREMKLPLPAACVSISPFADLTLSGETHRTNALKDVTGSAFPKTAARMYLDGSDPRAPLASPIFANLKDLPPLLVVVGADESLYSDAESLAREAKHAGVDVELQTYSGMIHVFPMFNMLTGDLAIRRMASFIVKHAGP
jgi:monoterpene epsilon-lactone hydrolase